MCFKKFWNWLTGKSASTASPPAVNLGPEGNMFIAVINKSSIISNDEVKLMTLGVALQAREHAAPAWDIRPPKVEYRDSEDVTEAGALKVVIFDDADTAGALGYHSDGPDGLPYGRVFVKVSQKNNSSVSGVLSHEVLEIMMDPQANYWADNWAENKTYALEVADPVESDHYLVEVDGKQVEVSNFVLPAWFDPNPPAGSRFDWMGTVSKPFTMSDGGYVIVKDLTPSTAVFGASFPEWKKDMKLGSPSRTLRREKKGNQ